MIIRLEFHVHTGSYNVLKRLLNRLDQQPGSGWRPPLSPFQFQKLLQNLTAIRIRTTFGEAGELFYFYFWSGCLCSNASFPAHTPLLSFSDS